MYGYIYLTKNKITGDTYVGQHSKPYFDNSYHGSGVNVRKQFAKYGVENFETTMIHAASSQEQLNKLEKETISHYRQCGMANLNIDAGGAGGKRISQNDCHSKWRRNDTNAQLIAELREELDYERKQEARLVGIIEDALKIEKNYLNQIMELLGDGK